MSLEDVFDTALSMANHSRLGVKTQIISVVRRECRRSEDGWAWVSGDLTDYWVGCSSTYAWRKLAELVDCDVLIALAGSDAGSRPRAYRLNPKVERWRIPWKVKDLQARRTFLELARGPGPRHDPAVVSRSHSARRRRFVSRSDGATQAGLSSRDGNATPPPGSSRAMESRHNPAPSALGGGADVRDVDPDSLERADRVIKAIEDRTAREVFGGLVARIRRLASNVELVTLLEGVASAPVEFQPPLIVERLERLAAGEKPARAGPMPAVVSLTREIDYLERQIALLEADDPWQRDEETLERLREQLADCQNALDREVGIA